MVFQLSSLVSVYLLSIVTAVSIALLASAWCKVVSRRLAVVMFFVIGACAPDSSVLYVPEPDAQEFAATVYPLLLRDCAFPACHGHRARFFRVFGPGRTRLNGEVLPLDPALPDEVAQTYARARSMLSNNGSVLDSLLLRKPLATSAGGAGHEGDDNWGGNVYETQDDPAYMTLKAWALEAARSAP